VTHSILAVHERNDDLPRPKSFVADVVCSCAMVFASEVHPSAGAARDDAFDRHGEHRAQV
jgi:hypothetical protein